MLENEKIIKENIKLPDNIVSETDEIKIEESDKEEIKIEKPENIKVAEVKFTEDQQKDINELLEAGESLANAKKIVSGEEVDTKTIDFEGKSEYEVDKEFFANEGIDLDLIIKTKPEAIKKSEEVFIDSAGVEYKSGYVSAKTLYEVNGYIADKDSEIKGKIRFNLGFGLDGAQFKENNIKNMLIKQITESGKYDKETLKNYLNKIEVKTVPLEFEGQKKNGLVYRIPKELGGTNMFAAVDSPKIGMQDLSDAVADSGPIVASIIAGTFGSTLGPMGTVVSSAVSAGFAEYARLWYGYHHLGLQNDIYPDPEKFNEVALNMAKRYAVIDAAATGVFLAGAKLILPTILGKSQLSTSTIKEYIETQGKTNTGLFKEVNKVKAQIKKEFNFTQAEVDNYFAVSLGKAILHSDQLIKKGSAAQRALLSDEVMRLETMSEFKELEKKILLKTTGVGEVGNKAADDIITNIQKQITGQAEVGIKQAELALLKNTAQVAKLEGTFIDDLSIKYMENFGVTLDDAYKSITARLSALDDNIAAGISKNTDLMKLNLKKALKIINKEMKGFKFSKGLFPSKLITKGKKPLTLKQKLNLERNNKLFRVYKLLEKGGFTQIGKEMKIVYEGFEEIGKKNINLKDAYALKNSLQLMADITEGTTQGQFILLATKINKDIFEVLIRGNNKELAKQVSERHILLEAKRNSFFNNFNKEFGHATVYGTGMKNLEFSSQKLFNKIINTTDQSLIEASHLGALMANKTIPNATSNVIKTTLYRHYLNQVIPDSATGKALMSHKEFFSKFGKNYEAILGTNQYQKLYNTQKVIDAFDNAYAAVADINSTVAKFLPGIKNWSALSNAGPGEIVEHILSDAFVKTTNLTKLLNALPTKTVTQIREIYLTRMMKEVTDGTFTPNLVNKAIQKTVGGVSSTTTINGAKMNAYLNANRSIILQLYDPSFFQTMRSMGDVLEMLQVPTKLAKATDISVTKATENAALFIDMIYGPLNHKRLILNRFSRLLDKTKMNSDNIFLFSDYALFTEAAKKNFLAGNYPAWIGKLPEKARVTFIDKALKYIKAEKTTLGKIASKYLTRDSFINIANVGLNRKAGLRKSFNLIPKKYGLDIRPTLKNPMVQKEYLEDKFSEMKGDDPMQDNADIFFPIDVSAKYAIKALKAVFVDLPVTTYKAGEKVFKSVKKEKERDIKEEKFEKELPQ